MNTIQEFGRKTHSHILDAIYLYFLPLRRSIINIEHIKVPDNFMPDELYISYRYLEIIKDSTCYNQGAFSQYWYLASQIHKELKDEFRDARRANIISDLNNKLFNFLNIEFHKSALGNFQFIHEFFSERDSFKPRICLKGFFKTNDSDSIITVFRDKEVGYQLPTTFGTNTGFDYVNENGIYYFCNDLFHAALNNKYINPRIDNERVKKISNKWFSRFFINWTSLWKESGNENKQNQYRSTIIIPITFANNKLNQEFLSVLDILDNKKRTIFGFLCIDHVKANYFNEELDVPMLYYFADLLSQYLFARLVFTSLSQTQSKLKTIQEIKMEDINFSEIASFIDKLSIKGMPFKSLSEITLQKTKKNNRFNIDEPLHDYIIRYNQSQKL